ncbi:MAG TPA: HNH endonuclease [Terracidiphilus sp.]|nr:HNH endonuclease [Terracidiphilus sp.]
MATREGWSRGQLIVALKLYCETPFGKMHARNPEIVRYANVIGRSPSALAMKLTNFASLDPQITSTGRHGLRGASQADREIWEELTSNWKQLAQEIAAVDFSFANRHPTNFEVKLDAQSYVGETKSTVVQARIGQSFFRNAVLSAYDFKCCITGMSVAELLVASHIVPWKDDRANRLNPRNGLCLSAMHDRAFDLGLIAISQDLRVLLSTRVRRMRHDPNINSAFHTYEDRPIMLPRKFAPDAGFLEYHRRNVFLG